MKQYKLIKEYPGSPKLNTEIIKSTIYGNSNTAVVQSFMIKGEYWFKLDDPENYPEFWELVVEKDYEILSLYNNVNPSFIINGKIEINIWLKGFDTENWSIHSVKRLSDGEIFTIGDKVNNGIIKSIFIPFEFGTTTVCIQCDNKKGIYLKDIQKIKQPLFTTEDDVDIFEGDECYYVKFINYNNTLGRPFEFIKINWNSFTYEPQYEKYFSTKEKAEEYILMNKPCLSYNEVLNTAKIKNKNTFDSLKELVKQKLNN